MSEQPDQEIQCRTTVINSSENSGISAAVHLERKDTICHVHKTNTKSDGTANQIRIHIFHFIHKHVCKHTRSRCRGYIV